MGIKVKDLAAMLNLSPSTVSLVLNNRPGISQETRNRVRQAVIDLGYEELLVSEQEEKKNILFLVYRKNGAAPASTPYFSQVFSEIIEGVEYQVKARGYNLMITYIDQYNYKESLTQIKKDPVEGVLVLATEMELEHFSALESLSIPVVIVDNYIEDKEFDCITINNELGVYEALGHLVQMGHTQIGYLHIQENANNFTERYHSFIRATAKHGLKLHEEYIYNIATEGGEAVSQELKTKLGNEKTLPTAFFADNDIVAICAIRVFRELGYRVPEDISIIGFDNMTLSELLDPPLTTIQIPKYKMGIVAVNTMIDKIREDTGGVLKIEVGTQLISRRSVQRLFD